MTENQMGLFEIAGATPERSIPNPVPAAARPVPAAAPPAAKAGAKAAAKPAAATAAAAAAAAGTASRSAAKPAAKKLAPAAAKKVAPTLKKVSGLVPEGDVRLTANIRLDLHLKLKIASAYRRTTIGEILEELIESHL